MAGRTKTSKRLRTKVRQLGRAMEAQINKPTGFCKSELKRVWYQKGYAQGVKDTEEKSA